jgi:hypothetical protein
MRVKFICTRAQKQDSWHPGRVVHSARLVPVVDDSAEAREYFSEPPAGVLDLDALASEHFKVGRTYTVYIEELTAESRQ